MSSSILAPDNRAIYAFDQGTGLERPFWRAVLAVFLFGAYTAANASVIEMILAVGMAIAALFPAWLWCSRRAFGIPIFPVFAATFIGTYALPLVSGHPIVMTYSEGALVEAALYVIGFLVVSTAVWRRGVRTLIVPTRNVRVLTGRRANIFFAIALAASVLFNMAVNGGWLFISFGVYAMLRSVVLSLSALGMFVLAYRWGARQLGRKLTVIFWILAAGVIVTSLPRLYLVESLISLVLINVAYSIARRKILWVLIVISGLLLITLQAGKSAMRDRYWAVGDVMRLQPLEYPAFFADWFDNAAAARSTGLSAPVEAHSSLAERASLLHILLRVLDMSPERVPYLHGSTYAILPQLLVPRVLAPNKIASHEGTYILNIEYGLQTREGTATTTIGWGLLNESIANFGWLGCLMLACLIGAFYAWVARFSMHVPILSFRGLFALVVLSFAVQTEYTAGVYVSGLAQALAILLLVRFALMHLRVSESGAKPERSLPVAVANA
jgi:hypothetical protein